MYFERLTEWPREQPSVMKIKNFHGARIEMICKWDAFKWTKVSRNQRVICTEMCFYSDTPNIGVSPFLDAKKLNTA